MSKLELHRIEYENIIEDASLKLNCEILQKEETKYGYQKAGVKLSR